MRRAKNDSFTPPRLGALGLALLVLPVLLYLVVLASEVRRSGYFEFGALDLIVLTMVSVHLCLCLILAHARAWAWRYAMVVYGLLCPFLLFEGIAAHIRHVPPDIPMVPQQRLSIAADTMPGITGDIRFTINERGVRGIPLWPPDRSDRVLCVGGSTTECLYVTDEKSWPWRLGNLLSNELARGVLVDNAGRSGHIVKHHAYLLRHFRHADDYGHVVVMCGINDMGTLLRDNYDERLQQFAGKTLVGRPSGVWYRRFHSLALLESLRPLKEGAVRQDPSGLVYTELRGLRQERLEANRITKLPRGLASALNRYEQDLLELVDVCKENKQSLTLVTQPTLYHGAMKATLAGLLTQHTREGAYDPAMLEDIMEQYNDVLRKVCASRGIACVDLVKELPKDTRVFYDDCHFNTEGCERVAATMQGHFVDQLRR